MGGRGERVVAWFSGWTQPFTNKGVKLLRRAAFLITRMERGRRGREGKKRGRRDFVRGKRARKKDSIIRQVRSINLSREGRRKSKRRFSSRKKMGSRTRGVRRKGRRATTPLFCNVGNVWPPREGWIEFARHESHYLRYGRLGKKDPTRNTRSLLSPHSRGATPLDYAGCVGGEWRVRGHRGRTTTS